MNYDNWTPDQLKAEIEKQKVRVRKVRRARIDKLWPTYFKAQVTLARNSMDAMTEILQVCGVTRVREIAQTEIAALMIFIDELEKQNDDRDIVCKCTHT